MFLTNVLLKKVKSKHVLVELKSAVSGHIRTLVRLRTSDKAEVIKFDPQVQAKVLYKEIKKIHGVD